MDDTYFLHQTPRELAIDLIALTPLQEGDRVLEPFRGEGAFYDSYPSFVKKEWCEATQGKDYTTFTERVDWVVTNPPYRIETETKRVNALWLLLDYYSTRVDKGIAFLINDKCFSTLTPRRLDILAQRGFYLNKVLVCSVKKWRGRYYYIIFQKQPNSSFQYLTKNY